MFAPLVIFLAHLLIALGAPTFVVAGPAESFEAASAARSCVSLNVGVTNAPVVCTDGSTFGL